MHSIEEVASVTLSRMGWYAREILADKSFGTFHDAPSDSQY